MSPDANASQADFFGHDPAAGVRELARALRLSLEPQAEKLLAQQLGAILRDFQASASSLESPAAAPVVWAAPAALRADLVRPSNLAR